jgi:hypothetical protein
MMLAPMMYPSGWLLRRIRKAGVQDLPRVRRTLLQLGIFPIRDHCYEPQFDQRNPEADFSRDRALPSIDWNVAGQLAFLDQLTFAGELAELRENDLLFIDSPHVIRPQGDVLFEYLEVLPALAPGVVVHVHDVYSPRNYPRAWLEEQVLFWNEHYLLEAFLTHNRSWEILGAVNYLHHHHPERLRQVAPLLTPEREPGSFYLRRRVALA